MPALQTFSSDHFTVLPANTTLAGYPVGTWRSTTSHGSGRYWFEINSPSTMPLIQQLVGLANSNAPTQTATYQIGSTVNSVGLGAPFLGTGGLYINATKLVSLTSFTPQKFVDIAVNLNTMHLWFLTNPSGPTWNFDHNANPTIDQGGWDISGLNPGPYYIAVSELVRETTSYPPLTIVTNDNISAQQGIRPMCYSPW